MTPETARAKSSAKFTYTERSEPVPHRHRRRDQRRGLRLGCGLAGFALALVPMWGPSVASAQSSDTATQPDCSENLDLLLDGASVVRRGTTSPDCTRHVPFGLSSMVDNSQGSARFFTFALDTPSVVTMELLHDSDYDDDDRPMFELLKGHYDHTTAVDTVVKRAINILDVEVPIFVSAVLDIGAYTLQISNYNWELGGAFSYDLGMTVKRVGPVITETDLVLSGITRTEFPESFTQGVGTYEIVIDGSKSGLGTSDIDWELSGPDRGEFVIYQDGVLAFDQMPDFESPNDSDGDNVYTIVLKATRGFASGSLEIDITVTDVIFESSSTSSSNSSSLIGGV